MAKQDEAMVSGDINFYGINPWENPLWVNHTTDPDP